MMKFKKSDQGDQWATSKNKKGSLRKALIDKGCRRKGDQATTSSLTYARVKKLLYTFFLSHALVVYIVVAWSPFSFQPLHPKRFRGDQQKKSVVACGRLSVKNHLFSLSFQKDSLCSLVVTFVSDRPLEETLC